MASWKDGNATVARCPSMFSELTTSGRWLAGCMGSVWMHADSFLRCVAPPFHSFVTTSGLVWQHCINPLGTDAPDNVTDVHNTCTCCPPYMTGPDPLDSTRLMYACDTRSSSRRVHACVTRRRQNTPNSTQEESARVGRVGVVGSISLGLHCFLR